MRNKVTAVCAALAVATAVAALWFGVGWGRALWPDSPQERAQARDAALDGARQAALNLNTVNPDDLDGTLARMESSATGNTLADIKDHGAEIKQKAAASKIRLDGKILGAALTELNSELDHAKAIVVLQQLEKPPGSQPPATKQVTWTLELQKVGDDWKAAQVDSLGQPVLLDGG